MTWLNESEIPTISRFLTFCRPGRREATFRPAGMLAVLVSSVFAIGACGSTGTSSDAESQRESSPRVKVGDPSISESELPAGCSRREVQLIFDEMLAGANSRNRSRVLRRIAPQPELVAFFMGEDSRSPTGDSGRNYRSPNAIYRYFANQSHRGNQRFLRSVSIQPIPRGNEPPTGPFRRPASGPAANDPVVAVGFEITVTRENDSEITLNGKAGINCKTGRFYVYSGG